MQEYLIRHYSRWKDQHKMPWKTVGNARGWTAGSCRHVRISERFSVEKCAEGVMHFLAATDIGKFPPNQTGKRGLE
jgi:hypothetical protein